MRAVVIGAGIGGLAAAAGLRRAGADVVVLERAAELRAVGAGLSLWRNGFTALDALGLGDAVRARTSASAAALQAGQRTPDGRWLARLPGTAVADLRVVHRADLQEVLGDAAGEVRCGVDVTGVSADGRTVTHSGGVEPADLVVAADGIRSAVRASWPGDPGLRYSGYSAWRGVTRTPVDLLGGAGETWGRGLRFGLVPLHDGRVYWFGVRSMPAGVPPHDEHVAARAAFAGWHAPIPAVLDATDPDAVHRLDIHDLAAPLRTFRRGRCVLLGDAAHAMTPDLGQGGGQALEDAATLVRLLTGDTGGVDRALDRYDALRRPRTARLLRTSRRVGAVAQASSPVAAAIRDGVVRLLPDAWTASQVAAVQRWEPPPVGVAGHPGRAS
ncbi:FAD-dependent monooxygenase [Pseudonocardia broussonetiae]|uniref:NAD(P)-binding protein n=1 Tax=Pseudonocardia broussonetiae TaxID=2736640 RepID=A0A6M6JL04_9PSEU|nr:FAD-dependent monooxygenase [Pseudonocardia broussonetiae]QJY48668.1 NAD(P)-binding protein [Pseudonocardia broussonetiae]